MNNPNCLVCYGRCGVSTRNTVNIFETRTFSKRNFLTFINQVLEIEIKEDDGQSALICKKCFKLFDELDELEQRATDIKEELLSTYDIALKKKDEQDAVSNTLQNEIVLPEENVVEQTVEDTQEAVVENEELNKGNIIISVQDVNSLETVSSPYFTFNATHATNSEQDFIEHDDTSEDVASSINVVVKTERIDDEQENSTSSKSKLPLQIKKIPPKKVKDELLPKVLLRDGTSYSCLLCPLNDDKPTFQSSDAKAVTLHMRSVHDAKVYICDVCGDDFRKRTTLSAHMDEHVANEEGDFQCETCNRIFSNLRLFRIHRRVHVPTLKSWTCDRCGKKYNSKAILDEHMNTHTGQRPYVCGNCGKDFASKYTFRSHEKTHRVRPRPFQCSQCSKAFLSQQNLNQHERTHNGIKEFQCHLCQKHFYSAHNLEVHSVVHTGYKPYRCRYCGKNFARKAEIRDHERTHTGERPFQCEVCGATFSQRSNLQSHKRATHFDDKRYKCDRCGKAFKRRRLLDYHVQAIHTGERPFKCGECKATFVYPEHFKKHRRIHTGEKPYHCEVCGKSFNSRDNRNAHRYVHSDKKPYECLLCGAGFMRKPLLYQHMQQQGHLNDTIVVNQPRLVARDNQIVTVNAAGELELVEDPNEEMGESVEFIGDITQEPHILMVGENDDFDYEEMDELEEEEDDDDDDDDEDSKMYITKQILAQAATSADDDVSSAAADVSGTSFVIDGKLMKASSLDESGGEEGTSITFNDMLAADDEDDDAATEHIIIESSQLQMAEEAEADDEGIHYEEFDGNSMILDEDKVDMSDKLISGSQASIINTKDGPIQLVQVHFPNDKGDEENTWVKIVEG